MAAKRAPTTACSLRHRDGYAVYVGHLSKRDESLRLICPMGHWPHTGERVALPTQLHREFVAECTDEAGCLRFANRYGLLRLDTKGTAEYTWPDASGAVRFGLAERVDDWMRERIELERHLMLWEALLRREAETILRLTGEVLETAPLFPPSMELLEEPDPGPPSRGAVAHAPAALQPELVFGQEDRELVWLWRAATETRDISPQARLRALKDLGFEVLGLSVTGHLRHHRVTLALSRARHSAPHRARVRQKGKAMPFIPRAYSLAGFIWASLAMEISLPYAYRVCAGCGILMAIHPDTSRHDRRTCSGRCRTRVSKRKRKRVSTAASGPR